MVTGFSGQRVTFNLVPLSYHRYWTDDLLNIFEDDLIKLFKGINLDGFERHQFLVKETGQRSQEDLPGEGIRIGQAKAFVIEIQARYDANPWDIWEITIPKKDTSEFQEQLLAVSESGVALSPTTQAVVALRTEERQNSVPRTIKRRVLPGSIPALITESLPVQKEVPKAVRPTVSDKVVLPQEIKPALNFQPAVVSIQQYPQKIVEPELVANVVQQSAPKKRMVSEKKREEKPILLRSTSPIMQDLPGVARVLLALLDKADAKREINKSDFNETLVSCYEYTNPRQAHPLHRTFVVLGFLERTLEDKYHITDEAIHFIQEHRREQ